MFLINFIIFLATLIGCTYCAGGRITGKTVSSAYGSRHKYYSGVHNVNYLFIFYQPLAMKKAYSDSLLHIFHCRIN